MRKILLFLLLFSSSITFAEEHVLCQDIDTEAHEQTLKQFYDLLITGGYRAREKNDTSDRMVMEFMASMMQLADGEKYDNSYLNNLPQEKLNQIKRNLPYDVYKSGFQYCCVEKKDTPQDKCLNEIFMEMIYRVAIKPLEDGQDFQNNNKTQNSSEEKDFIKQYIKSRLEIGSDIAELEHRWGPNGEISKNSSDSAYTVFWKWYGEPLINVVKDKGLTRKVEISNIRPDPREDGRKVYVATVSTVDIDSLNKDPQKTDWQIVLLLEDTSNSSIPFKVANWSQKNLLGR